MKIEKLIIEWFTAEKSNIYCNLKQNYANVCAFSLDKIKTSIIFKIEVFFIKVALYLKKKLK
jgi:hypothetical protein